jgi:hypothetical protein
MEMWFSVSVNSYLCFTGAKRARVVVYHVLSAACEDGDLSIQEAMESVEDIFRRNALNLYKLNIANGSINHETPIPGHSICLSSVEQDVLFVRIVWNDASGQHRCRVSISFLTTYYNINMMSFITCQTVN